MMVAACLGILLTAAYATNAQGREALKPDDCVWARNARALPGCHRTKPALRCYRFDGGAVLQPGSSTAWPTEQAGGGDAGYVTTQGDAEPALAGERIPQALSRSIQGPGLCPARRGARSGGRGGLGCLCASSQEPAH